ncbi:hypothetical protein R2F61_00890 [Mollicutes bacterium LVI A0078]|nr:hypothetical protein RZE84_00890 [Mollicutes bacterium LVI A0075]WOO91136.1 hypothetical protein R2F61_00890 [Mollicutes bacterium LVI A0078]
MKNKLMLIAFAIIASGCSVEAEPSSANNDLLQVEAPSKVLSAADVDLSEPYYFGYSDQVLEGYPTYKNSNPITITVDKPTTLSILGAEEPLEAIDFVAPTEQVELAAGESYQFETSYSYYEVDSSEPTTAVISVS